MNPSANEAFIAYFPNVVRVHAGDTVAFQMEGNGEPHTVTLGTLTNTLLSAFERLTPAQQEQPTKIDTEAGCDGAATPSAGAR